MLGSTGIDINNQRLDLAKNLGADKVINLLEEDPVPSVKKLSQVSFGSDAVIFTASTKSDEPLSQSFKMCRKR